RGARAERLRRDRARARPGALRDEEPRRADDRGREARGAGHVCARAAWRSRAPELRARHRDERARRRAEPPPRGELRRAGETAAGRRLSARAAPAPPTGEQPPARAAVPATPAARARLPRALVAGAAR